MKPIDKKRSAIYLYDEGRHIAGQLKNEQEKEKVGILRGGNAGALLPNHTTLGKSVYSSLARFLGYQLHHDRNTKQIFDGGFGNEAMWEQYLKSAITGEGDWFKTEQDYPLVTEIDGKKLTGSPDIVIKKDNEIHGVELKVVASSRTASEVFLEGVPKTEHFIQACCYSKFLNLPWELVYSSYALFDTNYWTKKKLGPGTPPVIAPSKVSFRLGIDDNGACYYLDPKTGLRVNTMITTDMIDNYYKLIVELSEYEGDNIGGFVETAQEDMFGNDLPYDPNRYDELQILTDVKCSLEEWKTQLQELIPKKVTVKAKKGKEGLGYRIISLQGKELHKTTDIEDVRAFVKQKEEL